MSDVPGWWHLQLVECPFVWHDLCGGITVDFLFSGTLVDYIQILGIVGRIGVLTESE